MGTKVSTGRRTVLDDPGQTVRIGNVQVVTEPVDNTHKTVGELGVLLDGWAGIVDRFRDVCLKCMYVPIGSFDRIEDTVIVAKARKQRTGMREGDSRTCSPAQPQVGTVACIADDGTLCDRVGPGVVCTILFAVQRQIECVISAVRAQKNPMSAV